MPLQHILNHFITCLMKKNTSERILWTLSLFLSRVLLKTKQKELRGCRNASEVAFPVLPTQPCVLLLLGFGGTLKIKKEKVDLILPFYTVQRLGKKGLG